LIIKEIKTILVKFCAKNISEDESLKDEKKIKKIEAKA
jgi:hypothetical protein